MVSALEVEKGLPPGLWLPMPGEPTDQYLRENFDHGQHSYEDIVDLGIFAVSLIVLDAPTQGRVSFMPTVEDLVSLYQAGYGISRVKLSKYYGGICELQRSLGFYPRGFVPEKEELEQRIKWLGSYSLNPTSDLGEYAQRIDKIVEWGVQRDLLPSAPIVRKIMGEHFASTIYQAFSMNTPALRPSATDLFRFGFCVLKEQGEPLDGKALDRLYGNHRSVRPHAIIQSVFGSIDSFWREFGYITNTSGLSRSDLINLGVRLKIRQPDFRFSKNAINALSRVNKFPSMSPIAKHCGGLVDYRAEVNDGYLKYLELEQDLISQGIARETIALACQKYQPTEEFHLIIKTHLQALRWLSGNSVSVRFVRSMIENGFNLSTKTATQMQIKGLERAIKHLANSDCRYIIGLIPRLNFSAETGRAV